MTTPPSTGRGWAAAASLAGLALSLLLWEGAGAGEPLRVRYATWVGYGPLLLAREKGFLRVEGVAVDLRRMEDPKEAFAALAEGRLDGLGSTVDGAVRHLGPGRQFQYVLALADSYGGDGLVARKEITSVRDLRGKRVAVSNGTASQFFLNVLLKEAGLRQGDLQAIDMTAADAGEAFAAGRVDAAVTWDVGLARARAVPFGHVLVDTRQLPGVITDVLIFRRDAIEARRAEIAGLVRAWHRALSYWNRFPEESNAIMARALGGWLEKPADLEEALATVRFYGAVQNQRFFGTPDRPGPLRTTVENALDIWRNLGQLQAPDVTADDLITHRFVE